MFEGEKKILDLSIHLDLHQKLMEPIRIPHPSFMEICAVILA